MAIEVRERRKYPRIPVTFRVALAFTAGRAEGSGELLNFSEGGCAVHANKRVPDKAFLQLTIHAPGRPKPLVIKSAAVRWVRGFDFGAEFVNLDPAEKQGVLGLIQELQESPGEPPESPGAGKP